MRHEQQRSSPHLVAELLSLRKRGRPFLEDASMPGTIKQRSLSLCPQA